MGRGEVKKLFISAIFVFLDIALNNNQIHALSVDYSKHRCNHEHPKAHEASGIFIRFWWNYFKIYLNHTS